jgi:hypothetical protein
MNERPAPIVVAKSEVPSPLSKPLIVVLNVTAAEVVGFATVPARPFALTIETSVTVPVPAAEIEIAPFVFVIVTPAPAVSVALVNPPVSELPMSNCPSVYAL